MATTVPSAGALALAGCMAFLNPIAAAEPALPSAPSTMPSAGLLRFDLRVQPLQGALDAYGALTGRSGFYTAESIAGRSSAAVQGRYTPEVALQRLLEGTGLAIHYTAPDAFVLEPGAPAAAEAPAEAARAPGPDDGLVQARVNEAFCGDPRLAAGDFRAALRFGLDAQGRVVRPLLLGSTGDAARDRAVLAALADVQLGRPPLAGAEQPPYVMLIAPRAEGGGWHCDARVGAAR